MAVINLKKPKNYIGALIVSAFASTIVVVIALTIKDKYNEISVDKKDNSNVKQNNNSWKSIIITFVLTFVAYTVSYLFLYYMFGYKYV